jgi:phosphatidylcholine synthase
VPWLVHAYTAAGAVLALLALHAVVDGEIRTAFIYLAAAVVVDATDGWLARAFRVRERLPSFDGARLDDIVDYLTFVFVPLFLIEHEGLLPDRVSLPLVSAALLASAYGFARTDAKTADHFFTGFPSYWNIVVLYVGAMEMPEWANAAVLAALTALVFVPIGYVYPSRTPAFRRTTVILGVVWGAAVLAVIWRLPGPPPALVYGSLLFPVYYAVLSVVLHARRDRVTRVEAS